MLELDCEGAEVEILRELTIQPRVILVETHVLYGAPTDSLLRYMRIPAISFLTRVYRSRDGVKCAQKRICG